MPSIAGQSPMRSARLGAQQRLTAGEPQSCARRRARTRARAAGSPRRTGARLLAGNVALVEGLARHAIGATEIAAVHDRDAQVVDRPAQPVARPHVTGQGSISAEARLVMVTNDKTGPRDPQDKPRGPAAARQSPVCRAARRNLRDPSVGLRRRRRSPARPRPMRTGRKKVNGGRTWKSAPSLISSGSAGGAPLAASSAGTTYAAGRPAPRRGCPAVRTPPVRGRPPRTTTADRVAARSGAGTG